MEKVSRKQLGGTCASCGEVIPPSVADNPLYLCLARPGSVDIVTAQEIDCYDDMTNDQVIAHVDWRYGE